MVRQHKLFIGNKCNHDFKDMTRNLKFMQNFKASIFEEFRKEHPEAHQAKFTPYKARRVMEGAKVFVCSKCGAYYLGVDTPEAM